MNGRVMVTADLHPSRQTTLTYVHEADRAVFTGVVDATNIEIFRDFLAMLPSRGDVVIDIADLELRVPEAASLLVETARVLGEGCKLVVTVDRPGSPRA
jgi:hypothetical protein